MAAVCVEAGASVVTVDLRSPGFLMRLALRMPSSRVSRVEEPARFVGLRLAGLKEVCPRHIKNIAPRLNLDVRESLHIDGSAYQPLTLLAPRFADPHGPNWEIPLTTQEAERHVPLRVH